MNMIWGRIAASTRIAGCVGATLTLGCGATSDSGPNADSGARGGAADMRAANPNTGTDAGYPATDVRSQAEFPEQTSVPIIVLTVGGKRIVAGVDTPGRIQIIEDVVGYNGTMASIAGRAPVLDSPVGVEIHGNSSTFFPKKSYNIEVHDDLGMSRALPVLGMPAESDWVLYACYVDKTCLRNALMYAIGREFGRYTPRSRFVEVYLDAKSIGLFLLVEKIKRDKNRVAVPDPAPDAALGDITGGYVINRQGSLRKPNAFWISKLGTLYQYRSPNAKAITGQQKIYIQGHIDKIEAAFNAPTWLDATDGYRRWIDGPSWVDFALAQEFSKNVDGYRRSGILVKDSDARGGRLSAGPLWDFDIALGNADYMEGWKPEGWVYQGNPLIVALKASKEEQIQFYWEKIWTDPGFQNAVKCRWQELRKRGPLVLGQIDAKIDAWVTLLARAEAADHALWPILGKKISPNHYVGATYADEVKYLRDWIGRRLDWMDANLPGTCMPPA